MKITLLLTALLFLVFGIRHSFLTLDYGGNAFVAALAALGCCGGGLLLCKGLMLLAALPARLFRKSIRILLILAATLLPRLFMIFFSGLELYSDYSFYQTMGMEFAEGKALSSLDFIAKAAPNVTVYGASLGLVMRIFGTGEKTALLFNLALFTGSVFSLDGIARELTDDKRAFLCSLIFALLPESILYSAYPGIEYITMFPMLLGLYLLMLSLRSKGVKGYAAIFFSGALCAFSFINRANVLAVLAGGLLWAISGIRKNPPLKKAREYILSLVLFLAAFALVYALYLGFQNRALAGQESASPIGWSLYEGLDRLANGGYTEEKNAYRAQLIETTPAKEMQQIFFRDALERVSSYSFGEWLDMFARKGAMVWFNSGYCLNYYDASPVLKLLFLAANGFWIFWMFSLVFLMLAKSLHIFKGNGKESGAIVLCLVPVLLTALWHLFATSIARYHYMMLPFLILLPILLLPKEPVRFRELIRRADRAESRSLPPR